ncbi:MAG: GNAT family N-acetyltransferase [Anaerolineae bacterium]|nr:GNAT family N-acetyltransferase [Anaerolineae bacterium]MBL6965932.1 GNAT family N-acetyltransferase [Anaerolineales bacterium]
MTTYAPTLRSQIVVRSATEDDRQKLATLIHFSPYVHRHLDWRSPLDWLGKEPFLLAERDSQIVAALACPPDIPELTWVRLFAVSLAMDLDEAWETLWPVAYRQVLGNTPIAALPLQSWFRRILESSHFDHTNDVIMLKWSDHGQSLKAKPCHEEYCIRPMGYDDLSAVHNLDAQAFNPVWQHSIELLKIAFQNASFATIAENRAGIIAYQICTVNGGSGHLARLAVHPQAQRSGVGHGLLRDVLNNLRQRGIRYVTVNTQKSNQASLSLYDKVGFQPTGEVYPIYAYEV